MHCRPLVAETLHHLILRAAGLLSAFHHVATLVEVLDVREAKRASAVLIACEFGDSGSGVFLVGELYHTRATRAPVRLVLNLSTLDFADCGEEFDEILVACAPRQL